MMLTNVPERRKRSRRTRTLLGVLCAIVVVGAILLLRPSLQNYLWQGLAPLEGIRSAAVVGFFSALQSKASLVEQNTYLSQEVTELQARVADRDLLYQENIELKAELGRPDAAASSTVLAGVLEAPPQTPYDTLLIDAGSEQGLAEGDLVAAGGDAYVGTLTEVSENTSRVELFSSPGESYNGLLNGSVPVELEGDGEGAFSAQVPAGTAVAIGDTVALPGIDSGVVATVVAFQTSQVSSLETLYLELPVSISQLQFVEVHRITAS